ncbi:MAG: TldD/PmbA family protein [Planctomycetes bacterium]|nr:TldD/PmbA family protein [Planctomycetota bacterium]
MLSPAAARRIFDIVLGNTRARDAEVTVAGLRQDLTRFAENAIHQNVSEESVSVSLRVVLDGRTGRATTGRIEEHALRRLVLAAEETARLAPPDADLLEVLGPQTYSVPERHDPATEEADPTARARAAQVAIETARAAGMKAAGYVSTGAQLLAHATSRGLSAHQTWSAAGFSLTVTGADSTGWVLQTAPSLADLDASVLARRATQKAVAARAPRPLPPGEYTVILEPAAVADLLGFLRPGFGARQVQEKQSFLTDRLGTPVFGANIALADDCQHPLATGPVFDGEGVPRRPVSLVEAGVARGLVYDRRCAAKAGVAPTGHGLPEPNAIGSWAQNLALAGGDSSVERMIAATRRGVLVTRFWYCRQVEPMQVVITGLTRDGTYWIEDGRVAHGLQNARFNQGVVALLNRVTALGVPERAGGGEEPPLVVPALAAEGFRFTG